MFFLMRRLFDNNLIICLSKVVEFSLVLHSELGHLMRSIFILIVHGQYEMENDRELMSRNKFIIVKIKLNNNLHSIETVCIFIVFYLFIRKR